MRTLAFLFAVAVASPAFAQTKDDLKDAKAELKEESKQAKQIESYARQWTGAWAKNNQGKMHKVDEKIIEWRKTAMDELRDAGVSTKQAGVDEDKPGQEKLRDLLVELRDGQAAFDNETAPKPAYKRKSELLSLIVAEMQVRVKRRDHRVETVKDALKGR